MIELYLVKPDEMLEIPTESVTWSGKRFNAARKIDARILYRGGGSRQIVKVEEGDTVLFKWNEKELFRGVIFNRGRTKNGILSFTAYDNMQYLLLNKDTYVFTNARADQIVKRVLGDSEIPYSSIDNTKYTFKTLAFPNETTLYDVVLKSFMDTEKHTKQRYLIFSREGKIRVEAYKRPESMWVLESGVNIEDFDYETSIDDTATRVKLVAGEEKKQIVATVTDNEGKKKFGVLQHYEKVTGKINQAQLNDRAKKTLDSKKEVKETFSISAIGIPNLTSGDMVHVIEKETATDRSFFVDGDTHVFKGNAHSMSLDLIKYNHLLGGT